MSERLRLVCLPYAGAGIAAFAQLSRQAGPEVEVTPVQLPGREGQFEKGALRTWPEVRRFLESEVIPALTGVYVIYGHSLGALMGYELCRIAEARGVPPAALCVAAYSGPSAGPPVAGLGAMDESQLIDYLIRVGDEAIVRSLPQELLELTLPALRADLGLADSWQANNNCKISSPVLALYGSLDDTVSASAVSAWADWTTGYFEVASITGDHLFVRDQATQVLEAVTGFAARCRAGNE